MRFNIRTKIIIAVSLSLVVIFALTMYLLLTRNISQLRTNLNQQATSFASLATSPIGNTFLLYQESGSVRITQQVNKFLELDPDVTAIRIVSVDGEQLYDSQNRKNPPLSADLASTFDQRYIKDRDGYIKQVVQPYFEDSGVHRYAVVYDISSKRVEQNISDTVRLILYIGIAILAVSIAVTTWLLNRLFIRPLRRVSHSANLISSGDFNQQIVSNSQDEIGDLAVSVNKMADFLKADIVKLRELDKMKTEFMMIASHNLRTPLTIMRGYIEMAEHAESADELRAIIKTVQESVVRLHLLSEDLLTISTLEAGGTEVRKTLTDAREFIDATVSEFEMLAVKKKLRWRFTNDVTDSVKLKINPENIRSALANVIDNAIKFTQEGGSVDITAAVAGDQLVCTVKDTGIGIETDEMSKLFTKFHRGTSTNKYDYEGVGIGLYLTKLLLGQHDGRITVKSEPGKGSVFTVYLPLLV
ncbi:MAG TPA: HAMP domain-containing sensor histidine kinase [Candidatus Saccharimonadales bacterium]|nr:HAMP domain-containing sensor histidine kinase [Candidatus Saccharimonadales bacterium]